MFVAHTGLTANSIRTIAQEGVDALMDESSAPLNWSSNGTAFHNFNIQGFEGAIYVGKDKDTVKRGLSEFPGASVPTRLGLSVLHGSYSTSWSGERVRVGVMSPFRHAMGFFSKKQKNKGLGYRIEGAKNFSSFVTRFGLQYSGYYVIFAQRNGITQQLTDINFNKTQVPMADVLRRLG